MYGNATARPQADGHPGSSQEFHATLRPPATCGVCEAPVVASIARVDPRIGTLCRLCDESGQQLTAGFEAALQRQRVDFGRQLAQMIRDRRNGAEEPTFFRGEIS